MPFDVSSCFCARSVAVSAGHAMLVCGFDADPAARPRAQLRHCPHFSFSYVFRGSGRLINTDGRHFAVRPGAIIYRFRNRFQDLVFDGTERYAKAYICLEGAMGDAMESQGLIDAAKPVVQAPLSEVVLKRWASTMDAFESTTEPFSAFLQAVQLLRWLLTLEIGGRSDADRLQHACDLLGAELHEPRRIDAVARQLGMEYHAFRRWFRNQMGVAPGEYRIRRRIEKACAFLAVHNVSETADLLGYSSPYAFSAQFSRYLGKRPKAYRDSLGV